MEPPSPCRQAPSPARGSPAGATGTAHMGRLAPDHQPGCERMLCARDSAVKRQMDRCREHMICSLPSSPASARCRYRRWRVYRASVTATRAPLRRGSTSSCSPRGWRVAERNSGANDLFFYLRGRTTLCRQRDVGERRVVRGSMPMFLFRGNMNDIAWRDDLLFRFCRDDALASGHK
jgi:hypothetical protein